MSSPIAAQYCIASDTSIQDDGHKLVTKIIRLKKSTQNVRNEKYGYGNEGKKAKQKPERRIYFSFPTFVLLQSLAAAIT